MRKLIVAALVAAGLASPVAAQRRADAHYQPPRPHLWADADTNSAAAYYTLGAQHVGDDPQLAADAFYWASRLHPGWADPLYARRVALLLQLGEERFLRYVAGQRSVTRAADVQAIDSLYVRALTADPFLYRKFDLYLDRRYWHAAFTDDARRRGELPNEALYNSWFNGALQSVDPDTRGYVAYVNGRFAEAREWLERATRTAGHHRSRARADLARVLYLGGERQRSAEVMAEAIGDMRREDERDLVFAYESKALLEHSVAIAREELGDRAGAREAYGRALQEDLAFYPAHVRLGKLALAAGDTAAAVAELALAAQAAPDDGAVAYDYAVVAAAAGRLADALPQLERSVALEPWFAAPHLLIGRIYDASGMRTEAIQHLNDFVSRAPRDDPALAWARGRAAELQSALDAEKGDAR
ncbi:MAG TPA: tetratricopeptide repeat protein [Longimicrobium sp.]|nr:tetratricopeptide repeat protein [Longimicrobium sp.]